MKTLKLSQTQKQPNNQQLVVLEDKEASVLVMNIVSRETWETEAISTVQKILLHLPLRWFSPTKIH